MLTGLVVAFAGGLGATTRFLLDAWLGVRTRAPVGTVLINISGSFALGLLTGFTGGWLADPTLRLALGTGFLGGYTTFSTACVESVRLLQNGRGLVALAHTAGMLLLSLLAAAAGLALGWALTL